MSEREVDRDGKTGRFVTDDYVKANPDTTSEEIVNPESGDEEVHRDLKTGKFVTEEYAKENPDTTEADHV